MEELIKKLSELKDLIKAVKTAAPKPILPSIPAIPALKPPSPPSMAPTGNKSTKMPGMAPDSKKDPKKVAQQIKDGSMSTKTQKIMLKFDQNGQWSLIEKAAKEINPKDPILNPGKFPPKAISPEKLKEQQAKLEQHNKNKALQKEEVESSSEEET